jgi:hypothetical protein
MLRSSGFEPELVKRWDAVISERAIMNCTKVGDLPEYLALGYDNEILGVQFSNRKSERLA